MLWQYCKSDGHANKAISTTLGTQRLVTQQFLTQEFTEHAILSCPRNQSHLDTRQYDKIKTLFYGCDKFLYFTAVLDAIRARIMDHYQGSLF